MILHTFPSLQAFSIRAIRKRYGSEAVKVHTALIVLVLADIIGDPQSSGAGSNPNAKTGGYRDPMCYMRCSPPIRDWRWDLYFNLCAHSRVITLRHANRQ